VDSTYSGQQMSFGLSIDKYYGCYFSDVQSVVWHGPVEVVDCQQSFYNKLAVFGFS